MRYLWPLLNVSRQFLKQAIYGNMQSVFSITGSYENNILQTSSLLPFKMILPLYLQQNPLIRDK